MTHMFNHQFRHFEDLRATVLSLLDKMKEAARPGAQCLFPLVQSPAWTPGLKKCGLPLPHCSHG